MTFSQFGEDKWILENMNLPEKGIYLDVGAGEAETGSNTRFLDLLGWTGDLIDPHDYDYSCRTAIHEKCVIGDTRGVVRLYNHGHVTLSSTMIESDNYIEVDQVLLKDVAKFDYDLISIDVEGAEQIVLTQATQLFNPLIYIIEYKTPGIPDRDYVIPGYTKVHTTEANFIYKRNN